MNNRSHIPARPRQHSVFGCLIGFAMIGAGVYSILHPLMINIFLRANIGSMTSNQRLAGQCGDGTMIGLFVGSISGIAFALIMNRRNQRKQT